MSCPCRVDVSDEADGSDVVECGSDSIICPFLTSPHRIVAGTCHRRTTPATRVEFDRHGRATFHDDDYPVDPSPQLRQLFGPATMIDTETSPVIPPECYPFTIEWFPLALWAQLDHAGDVGRAPLHRVNVEQPGPVQVPTADRWIGSVCIRIVYANGDHERVRA